MIERRRAHLIIACFGLAHLYRIDAPPLDHHGHRQADTLAAARNLLEEDGRPWQTRVDARGPTSGITGSELPVYNDLVAIGLAAREWGLTRGGGVTFIHASAPTVAIRRVLSPGRITWIGRGLTLLFAIAGMLVFFELVVSLEGAAAALWATLALACSVVWFYFSRNAQPDIPAVSLALVGLYFFIRDVQQPKLTTWLGATGAFALAGLMKAPVLVLLFPAAWQLWCERGRRMFAGVRYWLFAGVVIAPLLAWLHYAARVTETNGLPYFFLGEPLRQSAGELAHLGYWRHLAFQLFENYTSWAIIPFALFGIARARRPGIYLSVYLGFLLLALRAGSTLAQHDYYGAPLTPMLCAAAGCGVCALPAWRWLRIAVAAAWLGTFPTNLMPFYRWHDEQLLPVEDRIAAIVPYDARVATDGGDRPIELFMMHRKGWSMSSDQLRQPAVVASLREQGCAYLVLVHAPDLPQLSRVYGSQMLVAETNLAVVKL